MSALTECIETPDPTETKNRRCRAFGHPDPTVIARWTATGDVYQTEHPADNSLIDGNITITTDDTTGFTVSTSQSGVLRNYSLGA